MDKTYQQIVTDRFCWDLPSKVTLPLADADRRPGRDDEMARAIKLDRNDSLCQHITIIIALVGFIINIKQLG